MYRIQVSYGNYIINNTVNSNKYGILLDYSSSNNIIINNTANSNINCGIYLNSSGNNTITNNLVSLNGIGIYLYSSDYNTITNNTASSNDYDGILLSASNNIITNNTANSNGEAGILLMRVEKEFPRPPRVIHADNNILINNTANLNSWVGICLSYSNSNTITNNNASSNSYGIYFYSSTNNTITNNTAENNTEWDFSSEGDVLNNNNTIINLFVSSANISFTSANILLKGVSALPKDPDGYRNISKYVNATYTSETGEGSWLFLNISYNDSDIIGVNESTLRISKYNETRGAWETNCSVFAESCGVDTENNIVYANITDFGSIFAPLSLLGGPLPAVPVVVGGKGFEVRHYISSGTKTETFDLYVGTTDVTYQFEGKNYTIRLRGSFDSLREFAINDQIYSFKTSEVLPIDLNNDGFADLEIKLVQLLPNGAKLKLTPISPIPKVEAPKPKPIGPICGDGKCEGDESPLTCPQDCPAPEVKVAFAGANYLTWLLIILILIVLALIARQQLKRLKHKSTKQNIKRENIETRYKKHKRA